MGLFSKVRNAIHKVDPLSKAIDKKIGNVDKKSSSRSDASAGRPSGGGSGPQTADMGKPQRASAANGAAAMKQAQGLAGARSGVGRLQKATRQR